MDLGYIVLIGLALFVCSLALIAVLGRLTNVNEGEEEEFYDDDEFFE